MGYCHRRLGKMRSLVASALIKQGTKLTSVDKLMSGRFTLQYFYETIILRTSPESPVSVETIVNV